MFEAAVATGSFAMPSNEPAPSFGTDEQAGPNGSVMVAESSAEGLAGADALGVEPAAESLEESSDEQAVSASGSTAAADTATAARRKRSVFMAFLLDREGRAESGVS
ncbi:hypothetical protein GCM10010284_37480 [Streptomyces rubiginosohelvolus]|nr:hypothetical protein GCM10010284_37480 [Streptomyces rubiginosohelvolus]